MKTHKKLYIVILSFSCSSCLGSSKTETTSVRNCELVTKNLTLEVHNIGVNNECHGFGDIFSGVLECGVEVEECVAMAAHGLSRLDCYSRISRGCW